MAEMHLVVFHIGPVQDFIATARRSRDLWFGSWLLSELAKAAALEIVQQNGNDISCLVFPAPDKLEQLKSFDFNAPNKVVARVRCDPAELRESVREAILRRLCEICDDAYKKIKGGFDREIAKRQVEDFPEFFWASYPFNGNYKQARDFAEALLNARKVTRNFAPITWGSPAPKCSLDGCRESVITGSVYSRMNESQLYENYRVQRGEYLCGVCLLKRHGRRGSEEYFFSTSHVAALPLLERLTNQHQPLVDAYIGKLKELGITADALQTVWLHHPVFGPHDGQLLFEERLREFFKEEEEGKLLQAKEALRTFLKQAFDSKKPLPYYTLLLADGDHVGKVIDTQETPEKHQELSRSQSRFALEVRDIVQHHQGSLLYSGGDDVLALVPLHTVLACARSLAETFRQRFAGFKAEDGGKEISLTLSVGIAVVHHLDPLSDALELARRAEKAAKSVGGKNALAVTLSKRGGVERTVKDTWGVLDRRLERFIDLHRAEAVPDGAAYELRDLARQLEASDENLKSTLQKAAYAEAKRILRRKKARRGTEPIAEDILSELEVFLDKDRFSFEKLKQLADELIIAREFAAAMDLTNIPLPVPSTGEVIKNDRLDH
ncbi:type III-B CRISPR-associated protein Cas10/Cmr2 [Candidatus Desulforudis audaxviator]|uniref:CRISPR-associated protein, Crm2 family n=1 Tax=Desulforudis audaxviator (strain MP104C) TaxID=477974 RepID=B1I5L0_DESAP|nr:type III-B CRISPR-associated protein Cas10/Cmr2 [Candidatus Desulforudis audaxviator]ACA60319.1 CRISPR-associated protein, Crm2 family [Candidatus Desulforudis audaxviator MP104C]AZK60367.1 CRISPR-associated RAMP Cmr2 [Candidatus Desulforudis audaxviator]